MSSLRRLTTGVQWIVGVGAATAVVLLFSLAGAPDATQPAEPVGPDENDALLALGDEIYAQRCASCHGSEGLGGQGPRLAGTVVVNYPDATEEIDVVTTGRNAMPSFALTLTDEEIAAVVAFTRAL